MDIRWQWMSSQAWSCRNRLQVHTKLHALEEVKRQTYPRSKTSWLDPAFLLSFNRTHHQNQTFESKLRYRSSCRMWFLLGNRLRTLKIEFSSHLCSKNYEERVSDIISCLIRQPQYRRTVYHQQKFYPNTGLILCSGLRGLISLRSICKLSQDSLLSQNRYVN